MLKYGKTSQGWCQDLDTLLEVNNFMADFNSMCEVTGFDFDLEKCKEYIHMRNPKAKVIPICAKTGEGIKEWAKWLSENIDESIK